MGDELLTAKQLAERAGISKRSINRIAKRLGFPRPEPGAGRVFTEEEGRAIIAEVASDRGQFRPGNQLWRLWRPNLGSKKELLDSP